MCSGIFWGFYIVLTRKVLSSSNTPFKPLNLSLTTTILSFLFLIPLIPLYFNSLFSIPAISSGIWAELVYLGIICTTVAYTFYCIGLKSMPAVNATFILLLETVVGVFLGIVFRHELFTLFSIIGAVLIIAAMIIINLS
jgi:drug/metabolite transporter (DMT)-like permease